jgi:hypothetical protein
LNRALAPTFDRLRRIGLGERMLKTAFAAGLAYWLGSHVPHVQSPYLAPIVAILVMQLTIADSVTSALQRLVAVMIGAPLAFVVAAVFGVNPLTVALMVLVSFVVGARFSLNAQGLPQVAITALLVMLVGSPHVGYALSRVAETAIGGIVGILVNALVAPPSYLPRAEAQVAAFGSALAAGLDRLANDVERGLTPAAAKSGLPSFAPPLAATPPRPRSRKPRRACATTIFGATRRPRSSAGASCIAPSTTRSGKRGRWRARSETRSRPIRCRRGSSPGRPPRSRVCCAATPN